MAEIDQLDKSCEGALSNEDNLGIQERLEMFLDELHIAKDSSFQNTSMMSAMISIAKEDSQKLYDRCHVNSHGKSSGGGGFTNSYQKNC